MTEPRILLVDDEPAFRQLAANWLTSCHYQVVTATDMTEAMRVVKAQKVDLILLDLSLPPVFDPQQTLKDMPRLGECPVIILTGHAERELALEAIQQGAWDFLAKPIDPDMLAVVVKRAVTKHKLDMELQQLKQSTQTAGGTGRLIGCSPAMQNVRALVERIAPTDVRVLVTGPSGTGKEVISRAIHELSQRANGPFVSVHCGAIPADLLESELFGYTRGAFTGAERDKAGLLSLADGGTLFLDEIGEMPLAMQVKLLRVLQEGTYFPVGGRVQKSIDIRVISATNADLPERVANGSFREDLFYRIKGVVIETQELNRRREDIPPLLSHFLDKVRRDKGFAGDLSADAMNWFMTRTWPGNIRELKNAFESVIAIAQSGEVGLEDIELLYPSGTSSTQAPVSDTHPMPPSENGLSLEEEVRQLEIHRIRETLLAVNQNRSQAARILGLSRQGLIKKIERYGL